MKRRKRILLTEWLPDVRYCTKPLWHYFTYTSKFLLVDIVLTNRRFQSERAFGDWMDDLHATISVFLPPGCGIAYSLLKRQGFQLLLFSFREIKCLVKTPHKGREWHPGLNDLKALATFYSSNIYSLSTHCVAGIWHQRQSNGQNKILTLMKLSFCRGMGSSDLLASV